MKEVREMRALKRLFEKHQYGKRESKRLIV